MGGFWVVVLGVESASSLARRAAACLVHYLGLRLLVDALALSSIVMKRCRESSISSSSRCGLSRVQNCGRLGGLHIFFQKKYSLPPSDRGSELEKNLIYPVFPSPPFFA